jgi:L-ascorbate metabolism protein UlaG (beta-lactamase superfamily)
MKITAIGHASILVEAAGFTILSDPWWRGPCFGAQWWNYPVPCIEALNERRIDYIYISHGHHDHLHPGTLKTLAGSAKVLVSADLGLAESIRGLGFDVVELNAADEHVLGGNVSCRIIPIHGDSLMVLGDGGEVCLNLNDALHSAPVETQRQMVRRLKELYPRIDYVFCGYGVASHFPNCYLVPGKDREATAVLRQQHFNRSWARLVADLQPTFAFPFAADVVFLEQDLFWLNEPTHNAQRPTDAFHQLYPDSPTQTFDIAPGFAIHNGTVVNMAMRQPVLAASLRVECADEIERANRYGVVADAEMRNVLALMQANLAMCEDYLEGYAADYRFLIRLRNSESGFCVEKRGKSVRLSIVPDQHRSNDGYDVVFQTRLPYLKWSYTAPSGDEILFVGSGGIFEYAEQAQARRNLHRELKTLLTRQSAPLAVRPIPNPRMQSVKRAIKRVIGRRDEDLYDLGRWTVFGERGST